ncbi:MAG: transaldolase [Candidatus Omnitrophica bacterium]|nr:transaldolase [Candidatus Omnitrophota bacterium]
MKVATENPLKQALGCGQSIWYDGLVSHREFEDMIREDGIRGATTNPTIFEKSLSGGEYDKALSGLLGARPAEEIYRTIAAKAVQDVADLFLPVADRTRGEDGFVSIEVSPLLAHDTQATLSEARELWRLVGRQNVMIKVPATREGIPAVRALIADGIHVNITLIFSVKRYREVIEAYLGGLEERVRGGKAVSGVASVASFFVSRVDTAVDKILEEKIAKAAQGPEKEALESLLGKAAIANSKVAYDVFEKIFFGPRFEKLGAKNARLQRPLWASTGTKNPRYGDVVYVEALMGPHTVDTVPPATLAAFRDHGVARARLKDNVPGAYETLEKIAAAGINLEKTTQELEDAGVKSFGDSYRKIIDLIRTRK